METQEFTNTRRWGEEENEGEYEGNGEITTESVTGPDGSVRKTVVEYRTDEDGKKIKIVKTVRVYKTKVRVNKRVEERRQWKKFGECAGLPLGPERGITSLGDEVYLDLSGKVQAGEVKTKKLQPSADTNMKISIICRNCGRTGHWTLKCPYKDKLPTAGGSGSDMGGRSAPDEGGKSVYRPPGARGGGTGGASLERDSRQRNDDPAKVRVTNLSEDTRESDLGELFRKFGPISRIYLAKDPSTGLSKGFAFVNYIYKEDAAKAIEKLNGYGYDNLILHVEWARPNPNN